jgi:hypothetical protein
MKTLGKKWTLKHPCEVFLPLCHKQVAEKLQLFGESGQPAKPILFWNVFSTTEVVPCYNAPGQLPLSASKSCPRYNHQVRCAFRKVKSRGLMERKPNEFSHNRDRVIHPFIFHFPEG